VEEATRRTSITDGTSIRIGSFVKNIGEQEGIGRGPTLELIVWGADCRSLSSNSSLIMLWCSGPVIVTSEIL
jgi:hypothetical protein